MAQKPLALIYFHPDHQEMAKDVAARIRNDGGDARLVWAHQFRQPEDLNGEAQAVVIQQSVGNSKLIAETYAAFSAGVEIHFVDDDGQFTEGEGFEPSTSQPEEAEQAEATDAPVQADDGEHGEADSAQAPPAEDADA